MSAGDQNRSRGAQFKCLSDPTVPLSVWIVSKCLLIFHWL
jgi:hypothetical protein